MKNVETLHTLHEWKLFIQPQERLKTFHTRCCQFFHVWLYLKYFCDVVKLKILHPIVVVVVAQVLKAIYIT